MANYGRPVLRPWIRELILGSETLSSPRPGQLLKVLWDSETPGPSSAPDSPDTGAMLLVSDGVCSVRCLVTSEALDASDWEEKEFGFCGKEGQLLLLKACEVRIQVAEGDVPSEFYLQVDRFTMLPTDQPRVQVTDCNQDSDVQKKLYDCLEDHLSESTSSSAVRCLVPFPGLTLSQLLDEVQEEQEHRGALVRLAESCLMLKGPCTAPPLTQWAASYCNAMVEDMYTVSGLLLHISDNDQQILRSLGSSRRAQQGTPTSPSHMPLEESGASISLLPALSLVTPELEQEDSSSSPPANCSASKILTHSPQHPSCVSASCTPTFSPIGHAPSQHGASVTKAQKLEFKEVELSPQNGQRLPMTPAKGTQEPCSVWVSIYSAIGREIGSPQRDIVMALLSNISMSHPVPPSVPKSKLPGSLLSLWPGLCST
ncbi:PREDICTED: adrenocortical dysplasia protein homolog isoform X2 [Dipodomys ordii]|uniref:Adrenocortical dysplasia protein homolog isoform X2 n=1 Tax=Dipodomys ordii TaxID=10020 RepID=A0A1S3EY55_DIPOR|nr:PREDICTED: adrenocortical dysplasia protein homolog isoform X2 [Dipodomys ordii]